MDLSSITPLILTFNETANIRNTLQRLSWAKTIVVIDSFSTDDTRKLIAEFPNTVVLERQFDHFADQCNFGLRNIRTTWTLSLDADYLCPPELPGELSELDETCSGYRARFRYCVNGSPLRGTLYPPRTVLYRTSAACYVRDGHAHRVNIVGNIGQLRSIIDHDDRKPLARWIQSQTGYASHEADKLLGADPAELNWKDRLRTWILLAPALTVIYCLFVKGLILDGWPGLYYTLQRVYAELLLSIELLDRRLISTTHDDVTK